jgi:hypothetical protein
MGMQNTKQATSIWLLAIYGLLVKKTKSIAIHTKDLGKSKYLI